MSFRGRRGYGPRYSSNGRGFGPRLPPPNGRGFASPQVTPPRRHMLLRNGEDWRSWCELSVRITGLHPNATPAELYGLFSLYGSIVRIQIDIDHYGTRTGVATLTFSPPPSFAFWETEKVSLRFENSRVEWPLEMKLLDKKRTFEHPSPVNSKKMYQERTTFEGVSLDFGFMYGAGTMKIMKTIEAMEHKVTCVLDLLRRRLEIFFYLDLESIDPNAMVSDDVSLSASSAASGDGETNYMFMIRIPLQQLHFVVERDFGSNSKELIIPLETPPQVFRRTHDIETTQLEDARYWNDQWTWYRQTDIPGHDPSLKQAAITLAKPGATIDIGRWTTYRLVFRKDKIKIPLYNDMCQALKDYNITVSAPNDFHVMTGHTSTLWDWVDGTHDDTVSGNSWMLDMATEKVHLPFRLRYQIEVCITRGFLNEHNITKAFVDRLKALNEQEAVDRLELVAEMKKRVFDPMDIFTLNLPGNSSSRSIPAYCIYASSATITPSTVYYSSPTVETSNRVIRQWQEHADRFLRVRFTDEKLEGKVRAPDNATYNAVFARIRRCLKNGITIGDRHFEFLAFGNSQFREHGAYFFASTPGLSAAAIRGWMGDLRHIRSISRHASRLGQCFSTTRAINGTKVKVVEIADVKVGKYLFTDGVGKISRFLAQVIAAEIGLPNPSDDPPSVFQFRMGGCKGVLALEPDPKAVGMREVHIRESQYKFAASHEGLEVIKFSSFSTATLNRQLITILSCLQVPDDVFLKKLDVMLENLEKAMVDQRVALSMLQKQIDPNQTTLTIAGIMLDGFMTAKDPFALSILYLWRAWNIKALKEKAGIVIEKGAFVLGCTDETQTLQGHSDEHKQSIPEIFIQISQPNFKGPNEYTVIEGICVVARNPSMYPGDIRVVRAVNVPGLHHLKNVVVFPQKGDRDVPGMCSGGDLDGDDFFVAWDEALIPPQWNYQPMDFESSEPTLKEHEQVLVDDITSFFVSYMQNDRLGSIATAWLANSDWFELGAKSEQCIELAKLHSVAVDYPKSGKPAKMPRYLRPQKFPHFMESKYRAKEQIYHSKKVLGQLYDKVQRIDFHPVFDSDFDNRVLHVYELDEGMLNDAAKLKGEYDSQMRRIMAQHDIQTEAEVWTTFVMNHAQLSKDYSFHEEMGRISGALKERFRAMCYEKAGEHCQDDTDKQQSVTDRGRDPEHLGRFVAAMYAVTAQENQAFRKFVSLSSNGDGDEAKQAYHKTTDAPLMSFPWLFPNILGKLATGDHFTASRYKSSVKKRFGFKKQQGTTADIGDVETTGGLKHHGDLLELRFGGSDNEDSAVDNGETLPPVDAEKHPVFFKNGNSNAEGESDDSEYLSADDFEPVQDAAHLGDTSTRNKDSLSSDQLATAIDVIEILSLSEHPLQPTTKMANTDELDVVDEDEDILADDDEVKEDEKGEEEEEEEEEEIDIDIEIHEQLSALDRLNAILAADNTT